MGDERNRRQKPQAFLEGKELENSPVEEIGGKAFNLVRLKAFQEKYGFVVPEFFVIPVSYWQNLYRKVGFEEKAEEIMAGFVNAGDIIKKDELGLGWSRGVPMGIRNLYREKIEPKLTEVFQKLWDFGNLGGYPIDFFYLRSSSPLEDSTEDSFAGVFMSEPCPENGLEWNLKTVLLSPWTAHAEYYFRKRSINGKGLRTLAVLVQRMPDFKKRKYNGLVFFESGSVEIEYTEALGWPNPTSHGANKAIFDKDWHLVEHAAIPERRERPKPTEFLSGEKLQSLVQFFSNVAKEFPEFADAYNFEFSLGKDGVVYLFQARKTILGRSPLFNEGKTIPQDKVILRIDTAGGQGFTPGEYTGVIVNLLSTKDKDLTPEKLGELDQKYPGAIYIVRMHHGYPEVGETYDYVSSSFDELHNIYSPNKRGIIICTPRLYHHDHFMDNMRESIFLLFGTIEDFRKLPTGLKVGVKASTEEAVIYQV